MSKRTIIIIVIITIFVAFVIGTLLLKRSSLEGINWLGEHLSPTPLEQFAHAAISSDAEGCASVGR